MAVAQAQLFAQNPKNAPSIQKSKLLADFLQQSLTQDRNPQTGAEALARIGQAAIAKWGSGRADKALAAALMADQKSRAGGILEAITGAQQPPIAPQPQVQPQALAQALTPPATLPVDVQTPNPPPSALAMTLDPQGRSSGKQPLGLRNNNPGNIRDTSIPWQGAMGASGGFEQFDSPDNGLRAMARNLQTYGKRGLNNIEGIIGKWAPTSENDTGAYVGNVSKRMGADSKSALNLNDPKVMASLMTAMIMQENGQQPFNADQLMKAVGAAGIRGGDGMPAPQMQQPMQAQPAQAAPQMPMPQQQAQQQPQAPAQPSPQFGQPLAATPQELALVRQYLDNPATFDQGMAMANKIQSRMVEPRKFATQMINGVPTWVDEYNPGAMQTGAVPQAALSRTLGAQDLGIPAPQGTTFSVDPTGKPTQVYAPPAGYQAGPGGEQSFVRGGAADPTSGQNLIQGETTLRKEYDPIIKDYSEARNGFAKVQQAAKDNTGVSDIALIFGFMKTLDPSSTVREGEFATAQNSGSVSDSILNAYNKALKGERLQPQQRQQFAQTAASQFKVYEDRAKQANEYYSGLARSYGFDPSRIVKPITPIVSPAAAPAPSAAPSPKAASGPKVGTIEDGYRFNGGNPSSPSSWTKVK